MVSEDTGHKSSISYLIMRADVQEAMALTEDWWGRKNVPSYVHVRRLKSDDIDAFVDLYNRCFLASPDPFCPLTLEDARKLETEGIFVAELWGNLSGFIACFVENRDDSDYGEITGIGVLPQRRRKGIATALIQRAVEYFIDAGVDEVYCEVFTENIPSKMLIMAYGFSEVGRREIPTEDLQEGQTEQHYPGGKIMRRLGLRPKPGCESCRDL
jgi:ribosomal protein S18 acetylase RimI-like enzyme